MRVSLAFILRLRITTMATQAHQSRRCQPPKHNYLQILALPTIRNMKKLNRDLFTIQAQLPCVRIDDKQQINRVLPQCKQYMLRFGHYKPVQQTTDNNTVVVLDPTLYT